MTIRWRTCRQCSILGLQDSHVVDFQEGMENFIGQSGQFQLERLSAEARIVKRVAWLSVDCHAAIGDVSEQVHVPAIAQQKALQQATQGGLAVTPAGSSDHWVTCSCFHSICVTTQLEHRLLKNIGIGTDAKGQIVPGAGASGSEERRED
eukprot:1234544-Amphidinium_carterae.2